ncbi:MAG: EamA family transporter [Clostridia bacterium]|nr:EamA family transporter [Clostridia bacterium]
MKLSNNFKGSAILVFTALLWGSTFVMQAYAAEYLPPFFVNAFRSIVGALFLFAFLAIRSLVKKVPIFPRGKEKIRELLLGTVICGVLLTISVNLQQFGISAYPAGVSSEARGGFLTALYVVLVPLFAIFFKKRPHPLVWFAGFVALGGIALLCFAGEVGGVYLGDVYMLLCAISFTFHIFAVAKFGASIDGPLLCMAQFLVCSILSLILSFVTGEVAAITKTAFLSGLPYLLYVGVVSSGIAYTLQIVGQKYAEPAIASLSMSMESVFAALCGWIFRGSKLSFREVVGCAVVFLAIVMAQIPDLIKRKADKSKNEPEKV